VLTDGEALEISKLTHRSKNMKIDKKETERVGVKVLRDDKKVQPKAEEPKKEKKSKKERDFDSESISFRDEE
jgi:hypothetical protein